jgi:glycosyltransferase involved in cell wall biosynthesis
MSKKTIYIWETLSNIGGGQRVSLEVADILSPTYNVIFLLPSAGELSEALDERKISYHFMGDFSLKLGKKDLVSIFKYLSIRRRAKKNFKTFYKLDKPDLLYCPGPAALPLAASCGQKFHLPVVWHLHHLFESRLSLKLIRHYSKFSSVRWIIAVSQTVADQINNQRAKEKTKVIYNFVDSSRFEKGVPDPEILQHAQKGTLRICEVGFIQPSKCQLLLLQSLVELQKMGVSTNVYFAGSVRDEEYKQRIDAFVQANNLTKSVFFLGYRKDTENIYAAMDLIVVPSSLEGYSLVVVEAESSCKKIIVTNRGGAFELHSVFGVGFSFTDGDAESLAQAVRKASISTFDIEARRRLLLACNQSVFSKRIRDVFEAAFDARKTEESR